MLKLAICLCIIHLALAQDHENSNLPIGGRIVGGEPANIYDHPYQVALLYLASLRCGGVIIARTWVLTAASCVDGLAPYTFTVRAGSPYYALGGQVISVSSIIPHINYSSSTFDYDIALLRLAQPIYLSANAQIIRLPDGNVNVEGALANVTGWGSLTEAGGYSGYLQVVEVPVIAQSICVDLFPTYLISERMMCAGLFEGGRDACTGDGGGPLVINSVLNGLASWGVGCGRPALPGVYTNVGWFRDWITNLTGI